MSSKRPLKRTRKHLISEPESESENEVENGQEFELELASESGDSDADVQVEVARIVASPSSTAPPTAHRPTRPRPRAQHRPILPKPRDENVPAIRAPVPTSTMTKGAVGGVGSSSPSSSSSPSAPSTEQVATSSAVSPRRLTRSAASTNNKISESQPLVSRSIANRPPKPKQELEMEMDLDGQDSDGTLVNPPSAAATTLELETDKVPAMVLAARKASSRPHKRRRMAFESQVSYRGRLLPGSLDGTEVGGSAPVSSASSSSVSSSSSSASSSSSISSSSSSSPSPPSTPQAPERMHVQKSWKLARQVWLKHDTRTMMYESYYVPSLSRLAVVCSHPGCDHLIWDGRAEGDMRRHIRKHLPPLLECPECEHRFTRVDALKRHLLVTEYKITAEDGEEDERVVRIAKEQEDRARTYWELEKKTYLSVRRARNGAFVARA